MDIEPLATALDHARAFAASLKPGDLIDEKTGFTTDNLLAMVPASGPPTAEDAVIDQLGEPRLMMMPDQERWAEARAVMKQHDDGLAAFLTERRATWRRQEIWQAWPVEEDRPPERSYP